MTPANAPRSLRGAARLLVVDPNARMFRDARIRDLIGILKCGDLLVVNDAATLPASLHAQTNEGTQIELRLAGHREDGTWLAVLFGPGDWRTPTELRDPPERLVPGSVIRISNKLAAEVVEVSPKSQRLVTIRFNQTGSTLWNELYTYGKVVQYSYLSNDLQLSSVQTMYATRPWAVEMPSAGEALSWQLLHALRLNGVGVASVTHAAGLSSTGDEELDAALPLTERFDIPGSTVDRIESTNQSGGRVIAVGTTVVRAIEGCVIQHSGKLVAGAGSTDLIIDRPFHPAKVSGMLTGLHEPSGSHFRILRAFTDETTLRRAWHHATEVGYLGHEFGDLCLILGASMRSGERPRVSAGRETS